MGVSIKRKLSHLTFWIQNGRFAKVVYYVPNVIKIEVRSPVLRFISVSLFKVSCCNTLIEPPCILFTYTYTIILFDILIGLIVSYVNIG